MAAETENVTEEISEGEVVQPTQEEANESPESLDTQEVVSEKPEESDKDYNFRQMRETLKQREEEITSLRKSHQEFTEKQEELGNDDLVEGKHLKQGLSEIRDLIRKNELATIPEKIKSKFKDFDDVVTKKSLEILKKTEPELFLTLQVENGKKISADDLFVKGISAYKMIKSLGLAPENKEFKNKKEQIQSNHAKPMSAQSIKGSGAIHEANAFANELTPELKKKLYKEMTEAAKAY